MDGESAERYEGDLGEDVRLEGVVEVVERGLVAVVGPRRDLAGGVDVDGGLVGDEELDGLQQQQPAPSFVMASSSSMVPVQQQVASGPQASLEGSASLDIVLVTSRIAVFSFTRVDFSSVLLSETVVPAWISSTFPCLSCSFSECCHVFMKLVCSSVKLSSHVT